MPLKPLVVEKGIIQPSCGEKKRSTFFRRNVIKAGVLTSAGLPVRRSANVVTEWDLVRPFRINPSSVSMKYVDADVIYFSIPQDHFGHILTGTMAFAYVLLNGDYKNHKIAFIDKNPYEAELILLEHLGVSRGNVITVREYTQFRSVVVVKPSLRVSWLPLHIIPKRILERVFRINREFIDPFRVIAQKFRDRASKTEHTDSKVYFSRQLVPYNHVICEDMIERVFENNGYKIYHPEKLPLDEQIRLVANADFYACIQGTLEHHSLFLKDGATLIVMSRSNEPTARQVLINKVQTTIRHENLRTHVQPIKDRRAPYIIGLTDDLIEFFNRNRFSYDENELKPTVQDFIKYINRCLTGPRNSYLVKYILRKVIRLHKSFWKQMK